MPDAIMDADTLCEGYFNSTQALMRRVLEEEKAPLDQAASRLAAQISANTLMHISAILDEGTLLSNGALRSMAIERTPGYGKVVIANQRLGADDLLILVNAYGINAALIDAALEARQRGAFLIGISSRQHAENTSPDHPARHPTKQNLHDVVDIAIDCKVPIGDAVVSMPGMSENIAAISTFANAFTLNCLVIRTVAKLVERGITPPVWRSGNAPGGDEANARFIADFQGRVKAL